MLVVAGGAAAFALPWYAVLILPVLFAAGMSLLDTIDGCFMSLAYRWAVSKPGRRAAGSRTAGRPDRPRSRRPCGPRLP